MKRTKLICDKCKREISKSNFNKHYGSCKGLPDKPKLTLDRAKLLDNGNYECPFCEKEFKKQALPTHMWRQHGEGKNHKATKKGIPSPFKGMTYEERYGEKSSAIKQKLSNSLKGKTSYIPDEKTKKKISEAMKKAHAEGRAWNIGKSRWNNKPSYPEDFFMKVIENDFLDKDYEREFPFYRFSLDFAWIHKKRVIEIDGEQHERFDEYKQRDEEKDKLLSEEGWEILRIRWKDMFHDTKTWINISKEFIDKGEIKISKEDYYQEQKNFCIDCGIEIYKDSSRCLKCHQLSRRTVERPSIDSLMKDIETFGYEATGRKYNVGGNTIKKWLVSENIVPPRKRK